AAVGDPLRPTVLGQDAGRSQGLAQRSLAFIVALDEVADPPSEAAYPRSRRTLGADEPAAQFAPLAARKLEGKGAVGRIEEMVALVEHLAGRHRRIVEPAQGGLGHDQRVIGDDDPRLPRTANVLFDKAAAKMRTGGMHAFAAPVGERVDPAAADQLAEP